MNRREAFLAYGALIVVCIVWGTTYLAIRVAVRTLPDAWMSGVRFIIAGSILATFFYFRGHRFPPVSEWKHLIFVAICLVGFGNWLLVRAEKTVPSGPAALMLAVLPFYMVFFDSFGRRLAKNTEPADKPGRNTYIGLVIGFTGVALLVLPELQLDLGSEYLSGVITLQLASISWAIGSLYSKYRQVQSGPMVNASLQMIFGGVFLTIIAWFKGDFSEIVFRTDTFLAFLYLIVFGAMLGYACFNYALSKLPGSIVSIYAYVNPVIAVWLGWLILDERVTSMTLLATMIILFGVWLVRGHKKRDSANSEAKLDAA